MNKPYICRLLGIITLLIGGSMVMSLPWTIPVFGQVSMFDARGFTALLGSMAISALLGGLLMYIGRNSGGQRLFRKEAIAVVGLSWLMATALGALPFWFSGTCRGVDASGEVVHMDLFDGIFESASGFSGTGATVLTELEDPE